MPPKAKTAPRMDKGSAARSHAPGKRAEDTQASAHPPHGRGQKKPSGYSATATEPTGGKHGHGLTMTKAPNAKRETMGKRNPVKKPGTRGKGGHPQPKDEKHSHHGK